MSALIIHLGQHVSGAARERLFALVNGLAGEKEAGWRAIGSFQDCDYFVICSYCASVGRHSLAKERRKSSVGLAALIAPVAVFFAAGADVKPQAPSG